MQTSVIRSLDRVEMGINIKEAQENFWGRLNVCYHDYGDGLSGIYICANLPNCTLKIYAVYCMPLITHSSCNNFLNPYNCYRNAHYCKIRVNLTYFV